MPSIAIIEDDTLMRGLLTEWLTAAGYGVSTLTRADAGGNPVDLIVVDLCDPRARGIARVREARRACPAAPVIAISGQFRAGLECAGSAARALGVAFVIAKPLARAQLLDAVRSVIGGAPAADGIA
jgi:DNA-binding response OmpR family regulator